MTIEALLSGHRMFKDDFDKHRLHWSRLVEKGQHPRAVWIGCSDSRVIPEEITGARPGDLFVMRNVANVVPPYGTSEDAAYAVLEYAVEALGVEHIIVCGHTFCGGVQAILNQSLKPGSSLARWISWIEPARSHVDELGVPEDVRYLETIKANVLQQRQNVESYPGVSEAVQSGRLTLHAWLFDLETGDLSAHDDAARKWLLLNPPEHK